MAYGVNAPFGLRPLSSINGGSWTEKTNTYYISATADGVTTYASNIFTGDPVIWNIASASLGSGTIARYGFNTTGDNVENARSIVGVFMGCEYTLPTGILVKAPYWPASTAVMAGSRIKALVIDDPSAIFNIQVSTWTNVLDNARFPHIYMGQNFGLGLGGGGGNLVPNNPADGSIRTGQSGAYLATTFTANNPARTVITLPLKAIGYVNDPINLSNPIGYVADATTAPFLNVMVTINNHAYRGGSLGVVAA